MMGTFNCVYETPCGWCSKWDKKCDKKAGIIPIMSANTHGSYVCIQPLLLKRKN